MISVQVRYAFDVMGLAPEQVADVFMVLSGVLHLGNVTYVSAAGAQIAEKSGTALFLSLSLSPSTYTYSRAPPMQWWGVQSAEYFQYYLLSCPGWMNSRQSALPRQQSVVGLGPTGDISCFEKRCPLCHALLCVAYHLAYFPGLPQSVYSSLPQSVYILYTAPSPCLTVATITRLLHM